MMRPQNSPSVTAVKETGAYLTFDVEDMGTSTAPKTALDRRHLQLHCASAQVQV
jgi:hypothetical protein